MTLKTNIPELSELGKKSAYITHYDPDQLFPIPRKLRRDELGLSGALPFFGVDLWNHYEVSWLNSKGKPVVALAEIAYGCDSANIIESKSMKLYFNSLNNTVFHDVQAVQDVVYRDLEARLHGSFLGINMIPLNEIRDTTLHRGMEGFCLDELDIACSEYHTNATSLVTSDDMVTETLYSNLLKSNCLVTNQPDWCSVQVAYRGKQIDHAGLLRYFVSFRNDNEFHEQCIEKIFMDITRHCAPTELTVYGRSTRRGGLDINSYRSSRPVAFETVTNTRLCRQ